VRCLSVGLSVACLDIIREWKGLRSPKLPGSKHIIRITRIYLEIKRSKVKVTGPNFYKCQVNSAHGVENIEYNALFVIVIYGDDVICDVTKTPLTHCQRNANNRQTGGFSESVEIDQAQQLSCADCQAVNSRL